MTTLDRVSDYWNANPLGVREGTTDGQRWQENEKYAFKFYPVFYNQHRKILDAGCGTGFFTRYYVALGHDVTAVDLTEVGAHLTSKSVNGKAQVYVNDLETLALSDNTFDFIVCNGVVHHTPHPEKAVANLYRVLKPGGLLSIQVYYRNWFLRRPAWWITRSLLNALEPDPSRDMICEAKTPDEFARLYDGKGNPLGRLYTHQEFKQLLSQFKITCMEQHYFPMRFVPWMPRCLHRVLDRTCGTMLYAMAVKRE